MFKANFLKVKRYRLIFVAISILIISIILVPILRPKTIQRVVSNIKIKPLDNKVIVIDPGHGGVDGGTNKGDILEKNINLEVGLKLRDLLVKKGAKVVMTREIDKSLDDRIVGNGSRHREDLETRVRIINDSKADLFMSIHVNYSKNEKKLGPIVLHHINSEEGKFLAQHMQEYLNDVSTYKKMDLVTRHNIMAGNYYVAGNTSTPGIIIEMGFLSNDIDRKLLLDSDHQDEIIEQITKGLIAYFLDLPDPSYGSKPLS